MGCAGQVVTPVYRWVNETLSVFGLDHVCYLSSIGPHLACLSVPKLGKYHQDIKWPSCFQFVRLKRLVGGG